jgi:hypothetical protein
MFNRMDFGATLDKCGGSLHHFDIFNARLNDGFIGKIHPAKFNPMVHRSGM